MKSYAKENFKTRVARDVFLYDQRTMKFLVKPWGTDANHRADALYGNAFGTFICRPPKNEADLKKQMNLTTEVLVRDEGTVLAYDMSKGVIGFKTEELNELLGTKSFSFDDAAFECMVLPSRAESRTSKISASMTSLGYFLSVDKSKLKKLPKGFKWMSIMDATDPQLNVHASCIAHFLYVRRHVASPKIFRGSNVKRILSLLETYG